MKLDELRKSLRTTDAVEPSAHLTLDQIKKAVEAVKGVGICCFCEASPVHYPDGLCSDCASCPDCNGTGKEVGEVEMRGLDGSEAFVKKGEMWTLEGNCRGCSGSGRAPTVEFIHDEREPQRHLQATGRRAKRTSTMMPSGMVIRGVGPA